MNIPLIDFCNKDRSEIEAPFSLDGFTYATDGAIMIRVLRADVGENPKAPRNVGKMMAAAKATARTFVPVLAPVMSKRHIVCWKCSENRYHEVIPDCDNCQGKGTLWESFLPNIELGNSLIAGRYADLMQKLPGVRISPESGCSAIARPFYFKFDGGDGLIMPLRIHL